MQGITPSEALDALKRRNFDKDEEYEVIGEPDRLGKRLYVYFVKVWWDEFVEWEDVLFTRNDNGRVMVYNCQ